MAKVTNAQIVKAIKSNRGNISAAAQALGVDRTTIYTRMQKSSTLKTAVDEARSVTHDKVRQTIEDMALEGNVPLLIFYAKTQMGWKETQVTEQKGELTYNLNWGDNDD